MKQFAKITNAQISANGVQALADRPNSTGQYGVGGLSATQLKLWIDKVPTLLAEKINEIHDTLSGAEAAKYIRVVLDEYNITDLYGLVTAMTNGDFATDICKLLPSANASTYQSLQVVINEVARHLADNEEDIEEFRSGKVDKVSDASADTRLYAVSKDGEQTTVPVGEAPENGKIPLYGDGGVLLASVPVSDGHVSNKGYTDQRDRLLGAAVDLALNQSDYKLTLRLKNTAGSILSTTVVDLPLETMIIGASYNDGKLTLTLRPDADNEPSAVTVDISDLIDGLVSVSTYTAGIAALTARIDNADQILADFEQEVDLTKIYGHTAFYAEEADTARNYTKGGELDRELRKIKKRLLDLEAHHQEE